MATFTDPDEIEDGTGKAGAIVYGRTAEPHVEAETYLVRSAGKRKYAEATGNLVVGAVTTPLQEIFLIKGVRYVEIYAWGRVDGRPSHGGQALLQPRIGQRLDGHLITSNELMERWLQATWEAAELAAAGEPLFDVVDADRALKRDKTGAALEQEWFQGGKTDIKSYHAVSRLLDTMLFAVGELERG